MISSHSLERKTVLIAGATSLVGRYTALACARSGATVIALNRDSERLVELLSELQTISNSPHHIECFDMADVEKIPRVIQKIIDICGPVHCFVHATGLTAAHIFPDVKYQTIERQIRINAIASVEFVRNLVIHPRLPDKASGVFIAPVAALDSMAGMTAYAASRGAMTSAIRIIAHDLCSRNIRLNYLIPCPLYSEGYFSRLCDIEQFTVPDEDINERSQVLARHAVALLSEQYGALSGEIIMFDREDVLNVLSMTPVRLAVAEA